MLRWMRDSVPLAVELRDLFVDIANHGAAWRYALEPSRREVGDRGGTLPTIT